MEDMKIYKTDKLSSLPLDFYLNPVCAGFPSPAEDHLDIALDLNEHLIKHPSATFYIYAKGNSMEGSGIYDGDIMVVDRSLEASSGNVVIVAISGEFTVKHLLIKSKKTYLMPANQDYKSMLITNDMDVQIWGVVIHTIHSFR
jgi:DNA polymerase V